MTCNFTRTAVALALALGLAGCGGKASFPVSGTLAGVVYDGLVLSTNGMNLAVAAGSTAFTFPNSLTYGEAYTVSATAQPLHETCTVGSASDTAGRLASINVIVACTLNTFAVGGTITGLTTDGLTLTNGSTSGIITAPAATTSFTFGVLVPYGASYGVTVLTQPAGATCSVSPNGTGVMGDAAVTTIAINCVANPS